MATTTNHMLNQLRAGNENNFIEYVVKHCYGHFPHLSSTIAIDDLRKVVRDGIKQADQFGYYERGSVTFYIELLVIFGIGMATDPQYDWLQTALGKNRDMDLQVSRATAVQKQVNDYLDQISGAHGEYLERTAQELTTLSVATLSIDSQDIVEEIRGLLTRIYPQKVQRISDAGLFKLIQQGYEKSRSAYGLTQKKHYAFIICLMFLLGHEFDQDPFYPWARRDESLTELATPYEQDRAMESLERKARLWLEGALANERRGRQYRGG